MAKTLGLLVLTVFVCKIQSQEIEVSNVQYSQISLQSIYPSYFQTSPQQVTSITLSQASPSQSQSPVLISLTPQQYLPLSEPEQYLPVPEPVTLPAPAPVPLPTPISVTFPTPGPVTLPGPVPVTLPAIPPQPCMSAPQPVVLPTQPSSPTVILRSPLPQTVFQPQPPPLSVSPPIQTFQAFPPPPLPIIPPPVFVSTPSLSGQELPLPIIPKTSIPSPSIPSSINMISTTVVDNSLANKLANVLQLFMISKTIEAKSKSTPCNSPLLGDVTPLYDAIGSIGTVCGPVTEISAPIFAPTYGVADKFAAINPVVTVPNFYSVNNIGTVSEVISPFGDFYSYFSFSPDVFLPNQLAYNFQQIK